ncbi:MAG TPA: 23S rRNA (adenine(2503)-C(2))-methyltransferase RlmN [Anaerolineae bacterium]|nr:23S rRNA (adenine(2503)-C(2))-methyltransferase RlmN [Anaerolineae bacterium]
MTSNTPSIRLLDLSRDALRDQVIAWGQPAYRADQLYQWLYQQVAIDPAEMTNLPASLRAQLADEAQIELLTPVAETASRDGHTTKTLFRLGDGQLIETVLMRYDRRNTVCISSQAGCAMGCTFCATAQMGLQRNLTPGEIVAQVLYFERWLRQKGEEGKRGKGRKEGKDTPPTDSGSRVTGYELPITDYRLRITNVVVMGMGEPLANYAHLWQALRTLADPAGFDMGARKITVSTVGLVPGIDRFAEEELQINLAVSLHAPNDALRATLVPINQRYPIAEVIAACRRYVTRTHRRISFEYAMMRGINDSPALAEELATLLHGLLCHVNLIPLNPVVGSPFQPSRREDVDAFVAILQRRGIPTTLRVRRGIDIDAGCGQLRARVARENTSPLWPVS